MNIQAISFVTLSAILYGSMSYLGIQILNENFSVQAMLFWRFFLASLWMMLYLAWKQEKLIMGELSPRRLIIPFLIGSLCYSFGSWLYFLASQQAGTGLAMVIFFCFPVFVALFEWLKNKSSMNQYSILAIFFLLIGLFLLKKNNTNTIPISGIFLAITAAFLYAVYIFRSKPLVNNISSGYLTTLVCISCAVTTFITTYLTHTFVFPHSWHTWKYVIALGVIATALPIQLLLLGLKTISPLKVSILSVLEPVVTVIVGIILLNESISSLQAVGIFLILFSALVIQCARE